MRATGGIGAAMEAVGAIPTSMAATEVRQALDSGVVKAVAFAQHAHLSFGTVESGDWWTTNLNPGTVNCPVVANSDALESLSDAHRAALMESIDGALDHYIDNYMNNTMERWGPVLDEKGIERITFPPPSSPPSARRSRPPPPRHGSRRTRRAACRRRSFTTSSPPKSRSDGASGGQRPARRGSHEGSARWPVPPRS